MVHVGNSGAPESHCGHSGGSPISNIRNTPAIVEKPYIISNGSGGFSIIVPGFELNKIGPTTEFIGDEISFDKVYVARDSDSADTINAKLDAGLHLVLQPGQYHLKDTIMIKNANTVVIGLGMATLISENGKPCIEVSDVDGVKISGILL